MATERGDVQQMALPEERGKGTFATGLAKSIFVLLRNGLVASLKPHSSSDPSENNPILHRPHILRDLHFYETGMNQISILARAERSNLISMCLDMMPGLLHPAPTTPDYMVLDKSLSYESFAMSLGLTGPHEAIQELVNLFLLDCLVFILQEYEGGLPQLESFLVSWAIHHFQRYSKAKDMDQLTPIAKEILFRWSDILHYLTPWAANSILTRLDAILHSTVIVDRASLNSVPVIITGLSKIRLEPLNPELSTHLEALVNKLFAFAAFTFSISNSYALLNSSWQNLISNFLIQKHVTHLTTKIVPTQHGDVAIQLTPNSPLYASRVAFFDQIIANFKSHKRLQSIRGELRDYHPVYAPRRAVASLTSTSFHQNLILHGANTGAPCLKVSTVANESGIRHVVNDSMSMTPGSPIGLMPYTFRPVGFSPAFQSGLAMHADLSISEVISTFFKKPSHMGPVLITTIYHAPRTLEQLALQEHKYTPKSTLFALNAIYLVVSNYWDALKSRMNANPASFDVPKALMELLIVLDRVVYGFYVQALLKRSASSAQINDPNAAGTTATTGGMASPGRASSGSVLNSTTNSRHATSAYSPPNTPTSSRQTSNFGESDVSKSRKSPKLRSVLDMVRMIIKILYHSTFQSFIPSYRCWMIIETQSEFRTMLLASARKDHQTRVLCLSALFEAISDPTVFASRSPTSDISTFGVSNEIFNSFLYQWFCDIAVCSKDMSVDLSMLGKIELVGILCLALPVKELRICGLSLLHHMRLAETDKTTFHSILEQKTTSLVTLAIQRISRQEPELFLSLSELSSVEVWELMKNHQSLWWYFLAELLKAYSVSDSLLNSATTHMNTNFDALGSILALFELCGENSPCIPSYLLLLFSLPNERQVDFAGRVLASSQFHAALNSQFAKSALFAVQSSSFDALPLVVEYASTICSYPHAMNPYHVLITVVMIGELLQSQLALFEPFSSAQRNDKVNPKQRAFKKHQHLVDQIANILSHALIHMSPEGALSSLSLTVRTFCFDQIVQLVIALALVQSKTFDIQRADTEELVQDILGAKLIWMNRADKLAVCHFLLVELFNHNVACHNVLNSETIDFSNATRDRKYSNDRRSSVSGVGGALHGIGIGGTAGANGTVGGVGGSGGNATINSHLGSAGNATINAHLASEMAGDAVGSQTNSKGGHERSKSAGVSTASSSMVPPSGSASSFSTLNGLGGASATATPTKAKTAKIRQPFVAAPLTHTVLETLSKPLPIGLEELSSHTLVAWECLAQIGVLNELDIPLFVPTAPLLRSRSSNAPTHESKAMLHSFAASPSGTGLNANLLAPPLHALPQHSLALPFHSAHGGTLASSSTAGGGASRRSSVQMPAFGEPAFLTPGGGVNKAQDISEALNRQFTPRGSHARTQGQMVQASQIPISSTMSRLLDLDVLRFSILKWMLHYQRRDFKVTYDLVFTAMLQSTVYRKNYVIALAAQLVALPEESRSIVPKPTSEAAIGNQTAYPAILLATHVSGSSAALKATPTAHLAALPRIPERIFSLPLHQQLIFPCALLADSDRIIRRLARDMLRAIVVEQKKPLPSTLTSEIGANTISDIEGVALATAGEIAALFASEAPQMICEFLEKIRVASPLEQIWLAQLVIAFGVHVAPLTDRILNALYDATQNIDSRLDAHLGRVWGSLVHTIRPTWRNDLKLVVQFLIRASSTRSTISKILLAIYEVSDEHSIRITSILLGLLESKSILSSSPSQSGPPSQDPESALDSQQAIEAIATIIDSSPERLLQTCPRLTLYCLINHRSPIFASLLATILERASISPDIPIPVRLDICHTASLIRSNGLAHASSLSTPTHAFGSKMVPEWQQRRRGVPAVSGETNSDLHSLETNFDEPSDWDFPTYVDKIVIWLSMWDTNFAARFFEVVCEYVNKTANKDFVSNQSNLATAFTLYRCLLDDIHWNTKEDDVREQTAPLIILFTDLVTIIELEHSGEPLDYFSSGTVSSMARFGFSAGSSGPGSNGGLWSDFSNSSGLSSSTGESGHKALEKSRYIESLQIAETLASFARFVLSASSSHSFWALVALLHSRDRNLFSQALRAFWHMRFPSLVLIEGGKFDVVPRLFWQKSLTFVSVVDHLLDCLHQEALASEEANVLALALTLARSELKLISGKRPLLLRLFVAVFAWLHTIVGTAEYASPTTRFICHSFISLLFHMQQKAGNAQATLRARAGQKPTKIALATLLNNLHSAFEQYVAKPTPNGIAAMVETLAAMYLPDEAKSFTYSLCHTLAARPTHAPAILVLARCFLETSSSRDTNLHFPKLIGLAFELSLNPRYNIAFELQKLLEVAPLVSLKGHTAPGTPKAKNKDSALQRSTSASKSHAQVISSHSHTTAAPSAAVPASPKSGRRRGSKDQSIEEICLALNDLNPAQMSESPTYGLSAATSARLGLSARNSSYQSEEMVRDLSDTESGSETIHCLASHLLESVIDSLEGEATGLRTIISSRSPSTLASSMTPNTAYSVSSSVMASPRGHISSSEADSVMNSNQHEIVPPSAFVSPMFPASHTDDDAATEYEVSHFMAKQKKKERIRKSALSNRRILDSIADGQWENHGMLGGSEDSTDTHGANLTFKSEYQPVVATPEVQQKSPRLYEPLQHNMYHLLRASEQDGLEIVQEAFLQLCNDHMPKGNRQTSLKNLRLSSLADHFPFISTLVGHLPSALKFLMNRADISEATHDRLLGSTAPTGIFAIVSLTSPSIYLLVIPPFSQNKDLEDKFTRMCYQILLELGKTHFVFFSESEVQALIQSSQSLSDNDSDPPNDHSDMNVQLVDGKQGLTNSAILRSSSHHHPSLGQSDMIRRASSTSLEASHHSLALQSSKTSNLLLNASNPSHKSRSSALHVSSAFQVPLPAKTTGTPLLASGATNLLLLPEKLQQSTKLDMGKLVFSPEAFERVSSAVLAKKSSRTLVPESNLEYFVQSWLSKGGRVKFFPDFVNDHQQMVDFFRRYRPEVHLAMLKVERNLKDRLAEIEEDARSSISAMIDYYLKTIAPLEYRIVNQFTAPGATDAFDELRDSQIKHFSVELEECCPASTFWDLRRKYYEALWIINLKERKGMAKEQPRISNAEKADFIERMLTLPKFYKKTVAKVSDRAPMTLFVTENLSNSFLPLVTPEIQLYIQSNFSAIAQNAETLFAAHHTDTFVAWAKQHYELDAKAQLFDCLVPAYNELIATNSHTGADRNPSAHKMAAHSRESTSTMRSGAHLDFASPSAQTPPPLVLTIYKFVPINAPLAAPPSPSGSPKSPKRGSLSLSKGAASPGPGTASPSSGSPKQHRRVNTEEKKAKSAHRKSVSIANAKSFELTFVEEKVEGSPRLLYSSYYLTHFGEGEAPAKLVEARSKPLWILTQNERLLQVVTLKDGSIFSFVYNIAADETVIYVCYAKDLKSTSLRKNEASRFPGRPSSIALSPRQKLLAVVVDQIVRVMSVDWESAVWNKIFDLPQEMPVSDIRFAGSSRLAVFTSDSTNTYLQLYFMELVSALKDQSGANFTRGPLVSIPTTPGRLLTPNGQYLILLDDVLSASVYDLEPFLKPPKLGKDFVSPTNSFSSPSSPHETSSQALQSPSSAIGNHDPAHGEPEAVQKLGGPFSTLMLAPKFHNFVMASKVTLLTISHQLYFVGVMEDAIECLEVQNLEGTSNTARSLSLVPRLTLDPYSSGTLEIGLNGNTMAVSKAKSMQQLSPGARISRLLDVYHEVTQSRSMSSMRVDLTLHFVVQGMNSTTMAKQSVRSLFKSLVAAHDHSPTDLHLLVSSQAALESLKAPLVLRLTTKTAPQPESLEQCLSRLIALISPRFISLEENRFALSALSSYQMPATPRTLLKRAPLNFEALLQLVSPLSAMHALLNNWQGPIKVISAVSTEPHSGSMMRALKQSFSASSASVAHESQPGAYMSAFVNTSANGGPCLFVVFEVILPVVELQLNLSEKLVLLFVCFVSSAVIWYSSHSEPSSIAVILQSFDEIADIVPNLELQQIESQLDAVNAAPFSGKLFVMLSDVMASAQAAQAATEFKETYKRAKRSKKRAQDFASRLFASQSPSLFLYADTASLTYQSSMETIRFSVESMNSKAIDGERFAAHLCAALALIDRLQTHTNPSEPKRPQTKANQTQEMQNQVPTIVLPPSLTVTPIMSPSSRELSPLDVLLSNLDHAVQFGTENDRNTLSVGNGPEASLIDDPCVEIGDLKLYDSNFDMYSAENVTRIVELLKSAKVPKSELHYELQGLFEFLVNRRLTRVATWIEEQLATIGIDAKTFSSCVVSPSASKDSVDSQSSAIDTKRQIKKSDTLEPSPNRAKDKNPKVSKKRLTSPSPAKKPNLNGKKSRKTGEAWTDDEMMGGARSGTETEEDGRSGFASSSDALDKSAPQLGTVSEADESNQGDQTTQAENFGKSSNAAPQSSASAALEANGHPAQLKNAGKAVPYDVDKLRILAEQSALLRDLLRSRWEICEFQCSKCALECNLPLYFHAMKPDAETSELPSSLATSTAPTATMQTLAHSSSSSSQASAKRRRSSSSRRKLDGRTANAVLEGGGRAMSSLFPAPKAYRGQHMVHDCHTDHGCGEKCGKCELNCAHPYGHVASSAALSSHQSIHECAERHQCQANCQYAAFKLRGCGLKCSHVDGHIAVGTKGTPHDCGKDHGCNQYCAFCDQYCKHLFNERHKTHACAETQCKHSCQIHPRCSRPCTLGHQHTELHYCGFKT
jgi:hypothetical protein